MNAITALLVDDHEIVRDGLRAAGYLVKQASALILPKAIRSVHAGDRFLDPSIALRHRDRERRAAL